MLLGLWFGLGRGSWLIGGFVPIGIGLGLILSHWLVEGEEPPARGHDAKRGNIETKEERDPDPD